MNEMDKIISLYNKIVSLSFAENFFRRIVDEKNRF